MTHPQQNGGTQKQREYKGRVPLTLIGRQAMDKISKNLCIERGELCGLYVESGGDLSRPKFDSSHQTQQDVK